MDIPTHRAWMYDRLHPGRRGIKQHFREGVREFIQKACTLDQFLNEGTIRCPCIRCINKCPLLPPDEVMIHLHQRGFKPNYWYWTDHGEREPQHIFGHRFNHDAGGSHQQDTATTSNMERMNEMEKYIALSQAETQACTQEDQTGAPSRQKTPAELMAEAVGGRNKKGRFYGMPQHTDAPTSFSVTGPSAAQGSGAMETKVDYLMNVVGSIQQTLDRLLQYQTSLQAHGPPPVQPSGSGIHPVPQFNSADGQNDDDEYEDYSQ